MNLTFRALAALLLAAVMAPCAWSADIAYEAPTGVTRKFRDMGDGSWAEVVANKAASVTSTTMVSGVTATGTVTAVVGAAGFKTYQASGATTAGAGSCVVAVQGSNNSTNWDTIGTITLTLSTTTSSDSFTSSDRYAEVRGNVTTLTGTGAACSLTVGY